MYLIAYKIKNLHNKLNRLVLDFHSLWEKKKVDLDY